MANVSMTPSGDAEFLKRVLYIALMFALLSGAALAWFMLKDSSVFAHKELDTETSDKATRDAMIKSLEATSKTTAVEDRRNMIEQLSATTTVDGKAPPPVTKAEISNMIQQLQKGNH